MVNKDYQFSYLPVYQNSTGFHRLSELISKLLHSRTSHLVSVSPYTFTSSASAVPPCSLNHTLLSVPRCNSSFGQRSFYIHLYSTLKSGMTPLSVRQSPALENFKRIKIHYFANDLHGNWRLPPAPLIGHCRFSALYKLLYE